jgi:hydrogenase maturation protein HypF
MELEWLAAESSDRGVYEFEVTVPLDDAATAELDWAPMVCGLMADIVEKTKPEAMARKFHNTLAEMIARMAGEYRGLPVALSGGCFQNRLLTELTVARLEADGVKVYWHQRIPPNDGGIALGQVVAAARQFKFEESAREQKCV